MPLKLSEINKPSRTGLSITWGSETIQVWYDKSLYTTAYEDAIKGMADDAEVKSAEQWAMVLKLVVDWDITDDKDNHLPVNEETIAALQIPLLAMISKAVLEDISPNVQRSTASRGGSFGRR